MLQYLLNFSGLLVHSSEDSFPWEIIVAGPNEIQPIPDFLKLLKMIMAIDTQKNLTLYSLLITHLDDF